MAYISQITLPNGDSFYLKDLQTKLSGTCNTEAGAGTKTVSCSGAFNLEIGTIIAVTFQNANTAQVNTLKLSVNNSNNNSNSTPKIQYMYNGEKTDLPSPDYIKAGNTYLFYFDGSDWIMMSDTNKYHIRGSWNGLTYTATPVNNAETLDFTIPTGTSSATLALGDHVHGNINNNGALQTTTTIASNDRLIIADASDNNKIISTDIQFDGSTETAALSKKGTWVTYAGGTSIDLNGNSKSGLSASIYAPTTPGANNQILISNGSGNDPTWFDGATIINNNSSIATLTLGKYENNNNISGEIILYNGSITHSIDGFTSNSSSNYHHILPALNGYLATIATGTTLNSSDLITINNNAIIKYTGSMGTEYTPIYLNEGAFSTVTYEGNKIYFGRKNSNNQTDGALIESNHYITNDTIAINSNSITTTYTFEVNGKTNLKESLTIAGSIIPNITNQQQYDLGSNDKYWNKIYVKDVNTSSITTIDTSNNNINITGHIIPNATNQYSLGSSGVNGKRWTTLYLGNADTYGGGTQPIYWDDGVPKALTYTPNRLYYSTNAAPNETESTSFEATDHYATKTQLAINSSSITTGYTFEVNGTTNLKNHLNITGNIIPNNDQTHHYTLGSGGSDDTRWAKLYIGDNDSYGDEYTPIYWNNGVPAKATTIQKCNFTFNSDTAQLNDSISVTTDSEVISIVVTSGFSYLKSPISWRYSNSNIVLSANTDANDTNTISGYILITK